MRTAFTFLGVVLFYLLPPCANSSDAVNKNSVEAAQEKPLIIDIGSNRAPFTVLLTTGQATGLYIEFWQLWSKYSGIPVKFEDNGFNHIQKNLEDGVIDLHSGLFKNEIREVWADFSIPFHRVDSGLYYLESSSEQLDLESLNQSGNKLLAVHKSSYQESFLNKNYPNIPLVLYAEANDIFDRFINGEITAILAEQPYMDSQIAGKGLRGLFKLGHSKILANEIYAIVAKGNHKLLDKINSGILNIPIAEIIALEKKWLPDSETYFSLANTETKLTRAELDWVIALPELKLGIDLEWYPYDFLNENSKHSGLSADYLQYIKQQLPLKISTQTEMEWRKAYAELKQGNVDLLAAVVKTKERAKELNFTEPYAVFPSVVATYKESIFVQDMNSLNGKLVAIEENLVLEEIYRSNHPNINLVTYTELQDALNRLTLGEFDAVITDLSSFNREVTVNKLTNITIAAFTPYELEVSIGVRKGLEPLVPIINKILAQISAEQKSTIANKWLASKSSRNNDYSEIIEQVFPYAFVLLMIILYIVYSNKKLRLEILERKKIEASLELAKEIADNANEAKNNFLANMSHEIRTPMNAVVGMANLMGETLLSDNQKYYNDTIQYSAASLLVIINDILDLSKIEAGKLELDQHVFSLKQLIEGIHSQVSLELKKHQVNLSIDIDDSIPELLKGDSTRLGQVLLNLVHNAIKFTLGGDIKIGVNSGFHKENKFRLDFYVEDSGIGISKENIDKLFKSFSQADTSTTRNYGGTGLGLSICKQLCRLMGGDIRVESKVGIGSTFHFHVFFKTASQATLSNVGSEFDSALKLTGFNILLVDDNDINLFIAEKMLVKSGANVATASNGQLAIEQLKIKTFDAILMDIQMPVLDGYKATNIIRTELGLTNIPIIAITANVMEVDIEQGRKSGMNGHLGKPLDRKKMILLIKELVEDFDGRID